MIRHHGDDSGDHSADSDTQPRASLPDWITGTPTWALIVTISLALIVAITYGATRPNRGDPPRPQISRSVPSLTLVAPTRVSDVLYPAPELAGLDAYIASLEADRDVLVGIGIAQMARPFAAQQASWHGGSLHGERAYQTIAVPMAMAIMAEPKQPQDRSYLFNRSLGHQSSAATEAMWAFLGTPEQAGPKVDQVLRRGGDTVTVVQVDPTPKSYLATSWTLTDQAAFLGAVGCRGLANHPILSQMNDRKVDPWGMDTLPMSQVIGGGGPAADGNAEVRQMGLIYLHDGTRVSVAIAISAPADRADQARAIAGEIAYAIRAQATGFQPPHCLAS